MFTKKIFELLAIEIFRSKARVQPQLMNNIFHFVENILSYLIVYHLVVVFLEISQLVFYLTI